ncbi:MAG TPA: tRNA uridine-5-carboxymethylaminomethyl(34) synthesis enzyme MnmG [Firmicutes bacterium]|nr:tRNA uridine-5-carboxymethylaminomethyl(34) synthesis enzyme MnmG [Bacillota bacterium]
MAQKFDVIVIGAGHAGCEAALASAKMGCRVLLLTINLNNIAFMPCNPSIGGPGKGNLVREIDALGGAMGRVADQTYLQMRELNTQKGPAVRTLRSQNDKHKYQEYMRCILEKNERITIREGEVTTIDPVGNEWNVVLATGIVYQGKTVVIASGTFLRGHIHIGTVNFPSGPQGQRPAEKLSACLETLGLRLRRFKTGTPARVRWRSLDLSKMTEQSGDDLNHGFSFWIPWQKRPSMSCWLTYTNERTHAIIRENLHRAALYSGSITGIGTRYCPSIEGKIVNFPDRERHQVFIEPEGANVDEAYVAGLSSSLPEEIQEAFLRTIPGLERVEIVRPGYAIEYDVLPVQSLSLTLEVFKLPGLFCAGQINGTSGYEEAAAQGLIAGINAACYVLGREPFTLRRDEAYIGVLIDDLVNKVNNEPYRIMTSRAEFRLSLRDETADLRLADYGHKLGLLTEEEYASFQRKKERIEAEIKNMENKKVNSREILGDEGNISYSIADLLRRPQINPKAVLDKYPPAYVISQEELDTVINTIRYDGYIKREKELAERLARSEAKRIPQDLDYQQVPNLSSEAREKLEKVRPVSIGQAQRISGVSPADVTALLFYLQRKGGKDD